MLRLVTDLKAIRYNVLKIRKNEDKPIYLVVKANAYGHGANMVAAHTEDIVKGFAVADVGEGVSLRESGISKPILVLSFDERHATAAVHYGLTAGVYTERQMRSLARCGKDIAVHIAIDSGMHREGALPERADCLLRLANELGLKAQAAYTHYSSADNIARQNGEFDKVNVPFKHSCATCAVVSGQCNYDALRVGLAAYGYPKNCGYLPALTVLSSVENIVSLLRGEGAGYDLAYTAERDTKLAIVFGGYADGIRRSASGGSVVIKGKSYNIVGRVCMDSFAVDVGYDGIEVGDEVTILGAGITAESLAERQATIPYEVLCGFDTVRSKRYYV